MRKLSHLPKILFAVLACLAWSNTVEHLVSARSLLSLTTDQMIIGSRIQIVWPHNALGNETSAREATAANVRVALGQSFSYDRVAHQGYFISVPCDFDATPKLWMGINNTPAKPLTVGQRRIASGLTPSRYQGLPPHMSTWPVWDFDDIDVSRATRGDILYLFTTVEGPLYGKPQTFLTVSSVWSHGADVRTFAPEQFVPSGTQAAAAVDTIIRIVWPHDVNGNAVSVDDTTLLNFGLVNVGVLVLAHDTNKSVPVEWDHPVSLWRAGATSTGATTQVTPQKRIVTENNVTFPTWEFNDVQLSLGPRTDAPYYLWARVEDAPFFPAIWGHGADVRTNFPAQDVPGQPQNCP